MGCSNNGVTGGVAVEEVIKIPVSELTDQIQKFDYDVDGAAVTYFAVLGMDGEVRTAFDACDVCGGKKGYNQQGFNVVCKNCGQRFLINDLGTKNAPGGCWPSNLDHTIEEGQVVIKTADLARNMFRFK